MQWRLSGAKVSLGSGGLPPPGWLPTDIEGQPGGVRLDLERGLPFGPTSIASFHAEHVIEHLEAASLERLLDEIWACLEPGGVLRIATPNAGFFLELGRTIGQGGPEAQRHRDWVVAANRRWEVAEPDVDEWILSVNRAFRWWGHRFLYTRDYLDKVLARHRFRTEWHDVGDSRFAELRGIERHAEKGGVRENAMHTMVVDAIKPT
jgi:SAM-dependent methyltransferase